MAASNTRRKQFERGLKQLLEEGAIQMFSDRNAARREPILAAVGELQFDVVRFRLESEYNTRTAIEWLPYKLARWVDADGEAWKRLKLSSHTRLVHDQHGNPVVLFPSDWDERFARQENADIQFSDVRVMDTRQQHVSRRRAKKQRRSNNH